MKSPFGIVKDLTEFEEDEKNGDIFVEEIQDEETLKKRQDAEIVFSIENELNEFKELLTNLEMDPKLKNLWVLTYKNSLVDRKNALLLWDDLSKAVYNKPEMHTIHGDKLAKYMERAEKANGQLLKLAELIQKIQETKNGIEEEEGKISLKAMLKNDRKNTFKS
jgi:hypothetical protein